METENICENRKNGVYYTPLTLAEHLVSPLIKPTRQSVFDPAYGDGALLIAAERIFKKQINGNGAKPAIYGCDLKPVNGKLAHLPESNLVKQDFFDYPDENKYDLILMNPPYVRHHFLDDEIRKKYHQSIASTLKLKLTSGLWAYFLVKAVKHLKKQGSIGAILPWSFLQADYSQKIREWLLNHFREIKILALNSEYFPKTEERILMVWLNNYGQRTDSIKISFSSDLRENTTYMTLDKKEWLLPRVNFSRQDDIESLLQRYIDRYDFIRFGEAARVSIGVVTGADSFFILPGDDARGKQFPDSRLIPILSSAKEFSGLRLNGKGPQKRLLQFTSNINNNDLRYIREGEAQGLQYRAHSKLRTPWYNVNPGEIPDAFFPYRMSKVPYLMLNNGAQCTNSIHRVYFKSLNENQKKWLQLSLLAVPGQLALESCAKTYGRNVLKIEPGALKNAIVYLSDDPEINSIYPEISNMIAAGEKINAMKTVTVFLNRKLNIDPGLSASAFSTWHELQDRR